MKLRSVLYWTAWWRFWACRHKVMGRETWSGMAYNINGLRSKKDTEESLTGGEPQYD